MLVTAEGFSHPRQWSTGDTRGKKGLKLIIGAERPPMRRTNPEPPKSHLSAATQVSIMIQNTKPAHEPR